MADDINIIEIGNIIEFQSRNTIDENKYYGTILAFLSYDVAKQYMDIEAYHNGVLLNHSEIGLKEDMHYFLLRLSNQNLTICFAKEWILEASFNIIEKLGKLLIEICDVDESDSDIIRGLLHDHSFSSVRIISYT